MGRGTDTGRRDNLPPAEFCTFGATLGCMRVLLSSVNGTTSSHYRKSGCRRLRFLEGRLWYFVSYCFTWLLLVFAFAPLARRLHRKHNAELGLAAHHAGIGFAGFRQRILFNHRTHASQFGEAQRVFGVGGDSCRPTLDILPSLDNLKGRDFDGVELGTDNEQRAVVT